MRARRLAQGRRSLADSQPFRLPSALSELCHPPRSHTPSSSKNHQHAFIHSPCCRRCVPPRHLCPNNRPGLVRPCLSDSRKTHSDLSPCAHSVVDCIGQGSALTSCQSADSQCLCSSQTFIDGVNACLVQSCNADELTIGVGFGEQVRLNFDSLFRVSRD